MQPVQHWTKDRGTLTRSHFLIGPSAADFFFVGRTCCSRQLKRETLNFKVVADLSIQHEVSLLAV